MAKPFQPFFRPGESPTWLEALKAALSRVEQYAPDALVVWLGVGAFKNDPISFFKLSSDDFTHYRAEIAKLNLATMFVMEGGYAVDETGINTVNVLNGFLGA